MSDKRQPEIRYKGFTDAWEQRKVGDVIIEYKETVDADCDLPVLTSSKTEGVILQEEHFGRKQNHDITGYNILPRNYCTYRNRSDGVDFTFNINKCCDKGIISKFYPVFYGKDSDIFFVSLVLNNSDEVIHEIGYTCTGTGQKVLSFLDLQKMNIRVPAYEEQKKIAAYFEKVDHLITLHQRKCEQLKIIKKSMLEKMFPKEGSNVPEIRFKGFNDAWEQRKLSNEFSDFIVPMRDKPKEFGGNIPWTRIEDIEGKYLNGTLSEQYVTEETVQKMNLKIIPKNSLIVSSSATFGVVAVVTQDLITNQTFIGLVPNEKETLDYWYAFFHSDVARKYMRLQSAGSTIFYIARESFENMPINIPSKDEMIKIGGYFSYLDHLITLHQRELDKLNTLKKSCLEKMFV